MPTAHIVIDRDFTIGPVPRRLFGSFVEHMGRCVYTGIYEPGHEQADERGPPQRGRRPGRGHAGADPAEEARGGPERQPPRAAAPGEGREAGGPGQVGLAGEEDREQLGRSPDADRRQDGARERRASAQLPPRDDAVEQQRHHRDE